MYWQFSIRMMMFWDYKSDREIFWGMHDHNDSLDDGPAVKKVCPNWDKEPIGSTWETYLKNTFNATKLVSLPTVADPKQKFELRKAEDGHLDLPPDDFLSASLELQKWLVRDFMNRCWQEMAGRKGSAPFSKMTKDLAEFVDLDAGYLPDKPSLKIKDLSHMSKDNSAVVLSQQSKAGKPSPNVKPTVNVSTLIASSFSQMEHNYGSIDDSSSESSSDSDESENTVELWQCPNQHGATFKGQVEFLCLLGDQNEYLGLINVLHLTQVRTGSVEDALPGGLDWKYDNFHLPLEGHKWLLKHESAFGGDLFTMTGEVHGRAHLVTQALFTELKGKTIPGHYISGYIFPWCKHLSEQLKESNTEVISCRPHHSPADVKGKWHEARDFMLGLSSDKQYRQLVMSLEQIDIRLQLGYQLSSCRRCTTQELGHGLQSHNFGHFARFCMILHDIAMSKLTLATCAYPSLPSFVASTCITDSCVADAIQWCKTLRCTILKGSQHKPTAQKQPKPLADLPAAKKPRQDAAQEPVIAAWPTRIRKPKKMDPSNYLINKTGHGLQNS
ncbi:hypothetical protein PAXRUDRAFT_18924 [Paxillus rubicundulus Ve08.2h10]|uniref:Uncharacterized protein n=1 Tax=Paxillus rubicundulus Ve08.2h10 TaxID=930991 RepID=A0A0D0CK19_9AGAM|nr:hypothetical protein PAXRUDRAFT_18924 [Paxillus rubicundulus Ve08.2h10]